MKHKKICAALMAAMIGIGTMAASPASEAASREERQHRGRRLPKSP